MCALDSIEFNKDVTLDVGSSEIRLRILGESVKIEKRSARFDFSSAAATYKKKRRELMIKVDIL